MGYLQILGFSDFNNLKTRSPLAGKSIIKPPPAAYNPPPLQEVLQTVAKAIFAKVFPTLTF